MEISRARNISVASPDNAVPICFSWFLIEGVIISATYMQSGSSLQNYGSTRWRNVPWLRSMSYYSSQSPLCGNSIWEFRLQTVVQWQHDSAPTINNFIGPPPSSTQEQISPPKRLVDILLMAMVSGCMSMFTAPSPYVMVQRVTNVRITISGWRMYSLLMLQTWISPIFHRVVLLPHSWTQPIQSPAHCHPVLESNYILLHAIYVDSSDVDITEMEDAKCSRTFFSNIPLFERLKWIEEKNP